MNELDFVIDYFHARTDIKSPIEIEAGRLELAKLFAKLGYCNGAEIGVERGLYAEVLCKENPKLLLHAIDPWKVYQGYREHVSQGKLDGFFDETRKRLTPYAVDFVKMPSVDAVNLFADKSLDFVYIDGNHEFLHVAQDITLWSEKVRTGGIVAGHDFKRSKGNYINHVKDVVSAYAYSHKISPWFILRADQSPSWFWVKA